MQAELTREIDPALARLLADLPKGDPDAAEPDRAEVWIAFCEGSREVPVGVEVDVDFGVWLGPPMPTEEVVVHVKNLRTSNEASVLVGDLNWSGASTVSLGSRITAKRIKFEV